MMGKGSAILGSDPDLGLMTLHHGFEDCRERRGAQRVTLGGGNGHITR